MSNEDIFEQMRNAIELEMRAYIDRKMDGSPFNFKEMIGYQLGWNPKPGGGLSTGKRVRPLLLLLVCDALGGKWREALPIAVAIELLHNFTLIHDDIQDRSRIRRGRDALWVKWGEPQAINAGDAMYALAGSAGYELIYNYTSEIVLPAVEELHGTAFLLTGGQYLDIAFEKEAEVEIEDYWKMIQGKTGELISSCFYLGALLAGKETDELKEFKALGMKIGVAYQVQDDWLGIWGDQSVIGKSVQSDLLERKKTYPIIQALKTIPAFREYWLLHQSFTKDEIPEILGMLDRSSINSSTQSQFQALYSEVNQSFSKLFSDDSKTTLLRKVIDDLLVRNS